MSIQTSITFFTVSAIGFQGDYVPIKFDDFVDIEKYAVIENGCKLMCSKSTTGTPGLYPGKINPRLQHFQLL